MTGSRERVSLLQRKPTRLTAVFPYAVASWLFEQATIQGRSVSNLICHLVEMAMRREQARAEGRQDEL